MPLSTDAKTGCRETGGPGRNFAKRLLAAATACCVAGSAWAQAGEPAPDVNFLRGSRFLIPIQFDQDAAESVKELRLHVSTDQGESWRQILTAPPSQEAFKFKAPQDGEYWFSLTSVDHDGNLDPTGDARRVDQKVIVDTHSPVINLNVRSVANGQARAEWSVAEKYPDLSTLTLEARKEGDSNWRAISIAQAPNGSAQWPAGGASYTVRATVRDRAGNVGNAQLDLAGSPSIGRGPAETQLARAGADLPGAVVVPVDPPINEGPKAVPFTGNQTVRKFASTAQIPAPAQQPRQLADRAVADAVPVDRSPPRTFDRQAPAIPARRPQPEPPAELAHQFDPHAAVMMASRIPVASTQNQIEQTAAVEATASSPTDRRIDLVNSRTFAIDYELKGVGPSGVSTIELYYTRDSGKTWHYYGEDRDHTPPFEVSLPDDGFYGLKVVATSPANLGQKKPVPGEAPKVVLQVDTTPPEAWLYQPSHDPRARYNSLLISWAAKDPHFSDTPVSLYFAEDQNGPWYPIKTGLPAKGFYSWQTPTNAHHEVYLRLMAVDLAKNASVADTPDPILIDFSRPAAEVIRITTTRPGLRSRGTTHPTNGDTSAPSAGMEPFPFCWRFALAGIERWVCSR